MKETMTDRYVGNRNFFSECREILGTFFTGTTGKAWILFALVFCVLYLPFIDKAFHIDDVDFIHFSEMIGWNPLDATPADFVVDGKLLKDSLPQYEMTHPLLVPYVIKIVSALFGQNEIMLHLSFLFFPLLSLASLLILCRVLFPDSKVSWHLAALFLCSLPAFLVNSQNVMADVPTLSFLLLSIACYSLSIEKDSTSIAYLGGISLCAATFTSYQALFFIPLIFFYMLIRKRLSVHGVLSLAIPVVALLTWFLLLYHTHGLIPLLKGRGGSAQNLISGEINTGLGLQALVPKGISVFAYIGASMLFLVPSYFILNKSGTRFFLIFLPLIALSCIPVFAITGYSFFENFSLSLLVALGAITLLIVIKESLATSDRDKDKGRGLFLLLWIFVVVLYNMLIFPWLAARHILPVFPPLIIVLVNSLNQDQTKKKRIVIACALSLSVLFGLGSAFSDYYLAETYREIARDIKALPPGYNVWYIGKWGMQYYMDKAGARYLLESSNEPKEGDFVVIPDMPRFWMPSQQLQMRLVNYTEKSAVSPVPLRLYNWRSKAGFYSNNGLLLPFSFSREPDVSFLVLRVLR
jgi:4-amino-4-deoxy-L-arabinose transferase-like glycosyltransferase